jgi:hypothetical protein
MFRLNTKKNIKMTLKDEADVKILSMSTGLDLHGVKVVRNRGLKWNGAVACFSVMHPDTIFICYDQMNIIQIIPHIAHELKHREQYQRGKLSYLMAITFARSVMEKEAYAEEDRVRLELNL